jgi:hypothetical protein
MQDDHGNDIFTVQDAQKLRTHFISLLLERDEMAEQLEAHRRVLEELADIRRLLIADRVPFAATATTNGSARHYADGAGAPPSVDIAGDIGADTDEADCDQGEASMLEPSAADRRDEQSSDDDPDGVGSCASQIEKATADDEAFSDGAGNVASVSDREAFSLDGGHADCLDESEACERHLAETSARPPSGTLLSKILELIEQSGQPLSRWDVQKRLRLARMPSAELSRLTQQGHLIRTGEGIYAASKRRDTGPIQATGD